MNIETRKIQAWIDQVAEENPEALQIDGHDNSIVGIHRRPNEAPLLVYSETRIITNLMVRDGMTRDEARKFFDFNISSAWLGPGTPIILED